MGALAILLAAAALAAGPVNTAPPSITGNARVGGTVTVQPGSWTGNGTISFTYLWQSCDAAGASCQPWLNDSSPTPEARQTVPNVHAVVGTTLRCVVTAHDADGTASATTPPVKIVGANAPAPTATVTFVSPRNRSTVHATWLHVVVKVPGNPGKVTIGGRAANVFGGVKLDALVPLKRLGLNRVAIVARYPGRILKKTLTVKLAYPSLLVVHDAFAPETRNGLGCDPCKIADRPDAHGGADIDWATSSHAGGRLVHTIHVRNSLTAGGANVCMFVSTPGQAQITGFSVGCYGPKLNDGSRDHGPATIRRLNAHMLQISFAASQIGSPSWYLWRVWSHAGDHVTYDTVPNGALHSKTAGQVKQQLRFEVGPSPGG
jgi:hypothetical protein